MLVYLVFDKKCTGIPHLYFVFVFFGHPVTALWTPRDPPGKPCSTPSDASPCI